MVGTSLAGKLLAPETAIDKRDPRTSDKSQQKVDFLPCQPPRLLSEGSGLSENGESPLSLSKFRLAGENICGKYLGTLTLVNFVMSSLDFLLIL